MLSNPFPGDPRFAKANAHDNRFENLHIKLESIAGKSRSQVMTNMYQSTARDDIFTKNNDLPDSNIYQTQNYNKSLKMFDSNRANHALKFEKRPLRYFHAPQKQFDVPDGYDHDRLM